MDEPTPPDAPMSDARRGLLAVMAATLVAGVAGYLIQGIVPVFIGGPEEYASFSVFWSTTYLAVAALSGIQQEVTRAARPAPLAPAQGTGLSRFAAGAIMVAVLALSMLGVLIGPRLLGGSWAAELPALVLGAAAYVAVAVLSGLFYGLSNWWAVATTTIIDALVRLGLILTVCLVQPTPTALAWAVALPFPITAITVWLLARRRVAGRFGIDVAPRALARNSLSTVAASVATGVLTSGFAAIIRLTTPGEDPAVIGTLLFVLTLTRAPLVIPALALQSFLTVQFRDRPAGATSLLLRFEGLVVIVTLIGSGLSALLLPPVIATLWPAYSIGPAVAASTIIAAGGTAMLCVSGPAVLARSAHRPFVAGWILGAAVFVATLFIPLPVTPRVLVAMAVGPVAGVAVHLVSTLRSDRAASRMP